MQFKRKKLRGQSQKVRRTWLSEEGYRIVWRKEIYGVRVPARVQATVRTIIPNYGGIEGESFEMWDFTDLAHRLFKTRGKAEESCNKHHRLWSKACEATGIRQLLEIFGKLPGGHPAWVRKRLNRKVYELLTRPRRAKHEQEDETCSCPPDQPEASDSSPTCYAGPSQEPESSVGPASPATGRDGSTTARTHRARSKATDTSAKSPALSAAGPEKGLRKRSKKRTARRSKDTARGSRSTSSSSTSGKKRSTNSRNSKSTPCGKLGL